MKVIHKTPELFKRDTKGQIRVWWAEAGTDGEQWAWRTNSGMQDGKIVTSGWKFVRQKNVGRSNETSLEEQAIAEMTADFDKRSEREYFKDLSNVDTYEKFKPMLAAGYESHTFDFDTNQYLSQPKLDGIRCIARADGLWTRAGKEIVSCPHISNYLKIFFEKHPGAILDGELYNHDLKDDFNKITSLVRKTKPKAEDIEECAKLVQYHVYDCIPGNGTWIFEDRYNFLYKQGFEGCVQYVKTQRIFGSSKIDELYGKYLEDGYEGQMIRLNERYENKRSKYLLKRKEFLTDEFPVVDIEEGRGNWAGYIKRFILELPDGRTFGAGVRGTQEVMKQLLESNETPTWATLRYFTPTPDGVPRFPVVVDWGVGERED